MYLSTKTDGVKKITKNLRKFGNYKKITKEIYAIYKQFTK